MRAVPSAASASPELLPLGVGPTHLTLVGDDDWDIGTATLAYAVTPVPHVAPDVRLAARASAQATDAWRAVVTWWAEHGTEPLGIPLRAPGTTAARAAGLCFDATEGAVTSPVLEVVRPEEAARCADEVLDVWVAVTAAGGAVGFPPGTPRAEMLGTWERHLAAVRGGSELLCLLRVPAQATVDAGRLVGFGFWAVNLDSQLHGHVAHLRRFQVHPELQGRNLGRFFLGRMHRVARDLGIELSVLSYRSGLGNGTFYASLGYVECGRIPQSLQPAPGDLRDEVLMARRLDGAALVADGRR